MKLSELFEGIRFVRPMPDHEYDEAKRYYDDLTMADWKKAVELGKVVKYSSLGDVGNTTVGGDWGDLDPEKRERFEKSSGPIEMPIVIQLGKKYDLLSGNTRLHGLTDKGIDPDVLLVKLT